MLVIKIIANTVDLTGTINLGTIPFEIGVAVDHEGKLYYYAVHGVLRNDFLRTY